MSNVSANINRKIFIRLIGLYALIRVKNQRQIDIKLQNSRFLAKKCLKGIQERDNGVFATKISDNVLEFCEIY